MIAKVSCAALLGIDAYPVDLEVDLAKQGLPSFTMVGLAEGAVRESKERVMAALKNSGYRLPPARITVNLAPADMRKEGTAYDLPLALGLLCAQSILDPDKLQGWFFAGELSLSGEVKHVPGILPLAVRAHQEHAHGLMVSIDDAPEAAVVEGLPVIPVTSLTQAVKYFSGDVHIEPYSPALNKDSTPESLHLLDFAEVKGQEHAKRAIEIAASGMHNLLFLGPPGSGKTMLAQRIPTVLPELTLPEALEVTKIFSVSGQLNANNGLVSERPFRSPHHTISDAGLVGGGTYPKPGEVSLAHRGVLFLDELPEFKKSVLEVMRQPLEDGTVTISRAAISLSYPADFMLVAAMNPCPCGYLTDQHHSCYCTPRQIQAYRSRISGPLLDRIDLHVEVPAVPYKDLKAKATGISSAFMRERIAKARAKQAERFQNTHLITNSDLSGKWLDAHCALGAEEHNFLEQAVKQLGLSARAYTRVLRISRTIADLNDDDSLSVSHLAEALNYRTLDRPLTSS